jgi:hypothetical protein
VAAGVGARLRRARYRLHCIGDVTIRRNAD